MSDKHWIEIRTYPAQGHAEHPNLMFFFVLTDQIRQFHVSGNRLTFFFKNIVFKYSLNFQNLQGTSGSCQFFGMVGL